MAQRHIQFYRNGAIYNDRTAALAQVESFKVNLLPSMKDGEMVIFRYNAPTEEKPSATGAIIGYVYNKNNLLDLVKFMYDDGYFHRGVERLSDEQASRNLDKTMMWLEKGIIPSFLKEDMQEYMKKYKQSQIQDQERLKIEC